jgi:Cd2+/Zn2+-exporting ATPase
MSDACCTTDATPATTTRPPNPVTTPDRALLLAGAFIGLGAALEWGLSSPWAPVPFAVAVLLAVQQPARHAWRSVQQRVLDIHVLMVIAVVGAIGLGEWFEAAMVVWLFGISEWLEARSLTRARRAIREMMAVAPSEALVRREGTVVSMPVEAVQVGDIVLVSPGDRVPVDGTVLLGESSVNQAAITGESWPADKSVGDPVFAGSMNGHGALDVRVDRPAADSTIARIIHLVEQAQARRAPIQTFVDRFARLYTPAVVVLAVLIATVPPTLASVETMSVAGGAWGEWFYRALVLLVVSCPCALVISTPVAFVSALTAAARVGVLVKGGAHLERLAAVRCVAFDKTGTLTEGRVVVTDVKGIGVTAADDVLILAASLEARSEHPIGRAIVDRARASGVAFAEGTGFRALPGLGAEAVVASGVAVIGSHRFFESRDLCTDDMHARIAEVEATGATPVCVARDGAAVGVIGLADTLRAGADRVVRDLHTAGVEHVVLLTGDTRRSARATREASGVDEVYADLMPDDKVELIHMLRREHAVVAMVGDGINDAPALAASDVGIAMGAGSGVALDTADVALVGNDLSRLPFLMHLSRRTLHTIKVNVAMALGLKAAFVVLTVFGAATLWIAVLADTGASLLVVANSLRLLRHSSSSTSN